MIVGDRDDLADRYLPPVPTRFAVAGDLPRTARLGRALAASTLMTAGFGIFGLLSLPLRGVLQQYLPVVTWSSARS